MRLPHLRSPPRRAAATLQRFPEKRPRKKRRCETRSVLHLLFPYGALGCEPLPRGQFKQARKGFLSSIWRPSSSPRPLLLTGVPNHWSPVEAWLLCLGWELIFQTHQFRREQRASTHKPQPPPLPGIPTHGFTTFETPLSAWQRQVCWGCPHPSQFCFSFLPLTWNFKPPTSVGTTSHDSRIYLFHFL